MLNTEDFVKRLDILLAHYGMSAASFSDKIGIQRSSVSHLLSGRNKPSLDFILKIIATFPEVDLYWLLSGDGNLLREETFERTQSTEALPNEKDKIVIFHPDGTFSEYRARK
jgi:transcriptional regulator with XRE-family HTH domain